MESPVIPMARRQRLVRDYSMDDDNTSPRVRKARVNDELPPLPHVNSSRSYNSQQYNDHHSNGYQPSYEEPQALPEQEDYDIQPRVSESRQTSYRLQSPEAGNRSNSQQAYRHDPPQQNGHARPASPPEDLRRLDFNLEPITESSTEREMKSSYAPSISSIGNNSVGTGITQASSSRLPDFFAGEVFQIVLHNPTTAHQLLKFSQSRLCGENMEFLQKVDRYHTMLNDIAKSLFEIHRDYVSTTAPNQINIPESLLTKINKDLKVSLSHTLPKLESVFVDAQNDIERLVSMDIYPRFVRHQMTMSAAKALASDKSRYAGLGDCFVLTDPAKADNPIVYASDGFVKVTGYNRNEIIPRNCRFLQNRHTDKSAVKRLKMAIDKREESVELLLNEKKTGEPFWNLLYTTPIFDNKGNVVFFLGGQINCSTTIHSASDILRILALSNDTEEKIADEATTPAAKEQSRYSKLFGGFRTTPRVVKRDEAGMEGSMVRGMEAEKMNLRRQMDVFYTAYSKFMIVNASTMFITFHSSGIVDLLFPAQVQNQYANRYNQQYSPPAPPGANHSSVAGQDIFKFLAQHSSAASLPSGFKNRVKETLKRGQPVSVDLTMCTRRYMGFEKFAIHWTPLKDAGGRNGEGVVQWIVVTLGGAGD